MDKATIKAKVEALVAAPSCCNELKEAGERYLKAMVLASGEISHIASGENRQF